MVHDLVKNGKPDEAYAAWGTQMGAGDDPLAGEDDSRRKFESVFENLF